MIRWLIIAALSGLAYWEGIVLIDTRKVADELGRENTISMCYAAKRTDCDSLKVPPRFIHETQWQTFKRALDGPDAYERTIIDWVTKNSGN